MGERSMEDSVTVNPHKTAIRKNGNRVEIPFAQNANYLLFEINVYETQQMHNAHDTGWFGGVLPL